MAVHRALLAGQPGNRGDYEFVRRIDVEQVAHVARRVADAVLGPEPALVGADRLAQRRAEIVGRHAGGAHRLAEGRCRLRERRKRRMDLCGLAHSSPSKSCTCTGSPACTAPRSCSSTMKQFASDIERSTPEPCWPVVRTFQAAFSL